MASSTEQKVRVLVGYASKHGATQQIAERIAEQLTGSGREAEARPVKSAGDLAGYDAVVIGGAAYYGSWLKEAAEFVRRNQATLASRPVWLFSSGPLGTAATDAEGRDLRVAAEPKEFAEFKEAIKPRGLRVFFGALAPRKLGFSERLLRGLPAGRALLPEGDFRDWQEIEAWAEEIAHELAPVSAAGR
jgi:menaquinone-dependent protoporphyrinogen oxidase